MKTTILIASLGRGLLGVIASLAILGTASAVDAAETQERFIRQSLHEFVKDQNKLDSLIRGVQVMKSRNNAPKNSVAYRTSWEYWAAIHGYAGKSSPSGTVEEIQEGFRQAFPDDAPLFAGFWAGLKNLTPPAQPRGVAQKTWGTCEHGTGDPTRTSHFLSWHRIALYFFERVLREASGDPNFALPYWDYTNDGTDPVDPASSPGRIPIFFAVPMLTTPSGTIGNPLFERRRTAGFGDTVQLDLLLTNADSTLKLLEFFEFQDSLDFGVHGFIHFAVGNLGLAPYMGVIPFSANDPVFWVHHANIDRLWECWTTRNGQDANPTNDRDWMKKKFRFVNEKGRLVTMKVSELFDRKGRIDYTYDNVSQCFRAEPPAESMAVALQEPGKERLSVKILKTTIATTSEVEIGQIDQEVPLAQSKERGAREAVLSAVQPGIVHPSKAVLRLKGVRAEKPPGASVSVFLTDHQGKNRGFVGVLSFVAQFDHSHKAHARDADKGRNFTFDVSAQLHKLLADDPTGAGIRVALVASTGLAQEAVAVGQERYQQAGLRIRKILLEVESGGSAPVNPGE
ncbi:MAG: tyrosinase family protein [Gammaproteobacteria bacterium]